MHPDFLNLISGLDDKLKELCSCTPIKATELGNNIPIGGVYVFKEGNKYLYCGRTKRSIKVRVKNHFGSAKDCPFAWRIAREIMGIETRYYGEGTRPALLTNPNFIKEYTSAKERIKNMFVQYVYEPDPLKQALLEIYVSVALKTPYNDFNTH